MKPNGREIIERLIELLSIQQNVKRNYKLEEKKS